MYIYNNKNILFTKQHIYYKFIGSYITKNSKDDLSKILRKSREPTYRESFIIIWLEELSDLQLNESLYVCPTYQEIFKYKKKGWKFLSELSQIRLIEISLSTENMLKKYILKINK